MLYAPSKRISPNCDTALPILVSKAHAIILVPPWHRQLREFSGQRFGQKKSQPKQDFRELFAAIFFTFTCLSKFVAIFRLQIDFWNLVICIYKFQSQCTVVLKSFMKSKFHLYMFSVKHIYLRRYQILFNNCPWQTKYFLVDSLVKNKYNLRCL